MKRVTKLAHNWFHKSDNHKTGKGLYVTLEELMEQRQFVRYLHNRQKKSPASVQAGEVKSIFKGRGMEFEEIRPYNYGDDVRDIDWRVTARKLSPYTKLFSEERDREVYVLLDLSPQMLFGTRKELKTVTASKIAALLGWLALENKDRFGCVIFDGEHSYLYKPQNHRAGLFTILNKIAEFSFQVMKNKSLSSKTVSLGKSLQLLQNNIKGQSMVFLIGDFDNVTESVQKSISMLSRKTNLACVNVLDVLEQNPPIGGEYMAEFDGQKLIFSTGSQKFRKNYQAYFAKQRNHFKDFCRRFSCKYIEVRNDKELHKQLENIR